MDKVINHNGIEITIYAQKTTRGLTAKTYGRVRWYGVRVAGHSYLNDGGFSSITAAITYATTELARYAA